MLVKATIENILSYDAPTTFSLVAGKITKQHTEQVRNVNGVSVLRGAIVYGPNAAGKSNLLKAILALTQMLNGDSCRYSYGCQFKLTGNPRSDMSWDIVFSREGRIYRYLVKTDGVSISEERLWLVSDEEEMVFERIGINVSFGKMFSDRTWYEGRSFEKSGFVICTLKRDGIIDRRDSIFGCHHPRDRGASGDCRIEFRFNSRNAIHRKPSQDRRVHGVPEAAHDCCGHWDNGCSMARLLKGSGHADS